MIKYIFDFFIDLVFGIMFTIAFMDVNMMHQVWWIGIAIGIGINFSCGKWNLDRIKKLEKEIENLRENGNR